MPKLLMPAFKLKAPIALLLTPFWELAHEVVDVLSACVELKQEEK